MHIKSVAIIVGLVAGGLLSMVRSSHAEPGDDLTIEALTFAPGDHPFFKFGHNAILVKPPVGQGLAYNFGTFAFDSPALIPKFLRGRFHYWLSVMSEDITIEAYASSNRGILAQTLDLTGAQKLALARALRENAKPENREYLYDYFRDNCSTRVRDAVDRVIDGRVRAAGQAPGAQTYRAHALRMTADLWPEYVGLYLGLGRAADVPINRWDESFLPENFAGLLRSVRIPDGAGGEKPLVKSERIVFQDTRPPSLVTPPNHTGYFLAVGIVIGALLLGLGLLATRLVIARVLLGAASLFIGGAAGMTGLIMCGLWAFTDHKIAYANANILQAPPWLLPFVAYGIGLALGRRKSIGRAHLFAVSALISSLLGVLCKVLPGLNQDNTPFICLFVPVWLGLWLGLRRVAKAARAGTQ